MEPINKGIFFNCPVQLDDKEYINCTFENCVFEFSGGLFSFVNGTVRGSAKIALFGAAKNTLEFLLAFNSIKEFQPLIAGLLAGAATPIQKKDVTGADNSGPDSPVDVN